MAQDEMNTTVNVKGLDQILKALNAKPPVARVGILGDTKRTGSNQSNATVGAAHEFGTTKLPQRSFLRIPLMENLDKRLDSSGAFDKSALDKIVKQGNITPWMEKMAIAAEAIVLESFTSGGFGRWAQWKNPNYKNNSGQILVDTQQLRNSISWEVK